MASVFLLLVVGSALLSLAVGLSALRRRPDPMAAPLALLMFTVVAWAVPHALSLAATDAGATLFWERARYPATVVAPLAYLYVSVSYAGYERWLSRRVLAALAVVPVVTVLLVWTTPWHGLFWTSTSTARVGELTVVDAVPGPWYWVNLGYLYLLALTSLVVLGVTAFESGPIYRKQAVLMFAGGAVPLLANALVNLGVGPDPVVDLTTSSMAVTGATFALALFHFDLLDIRPVARDRLVEELDDGVVVVGPNGRVRDFNRTAARVLGDLSIDQPADAVFDTEITADGGEIAVEIDGRERHFRTRSTPLVDERGEETGRIVYLNDATEIVEREQRISVLNRVLRHNVRNELNVADGHLEALTDGVDEGDQGHVREARERIHRIADIADKARDVERTLRDRGAGTTVSASAVAERVVAEARERFPAAEIRCEPAADDAVAVVDARLFETALAELVENGVVHNDSDGPVVTVAVRRTGDGGEVRVVDNGDGISEAERRVLDARTERALEHGSGLGLWLVQWTAELSGGDLSFEDDGSVVVLSLPSGAATA